MTAQTITAVTMTDSGSAVEMEKAHRSGPSL